LPKWIKFPINSDNDKLITDVTQREDLPSSPSPFSQSGRRGVKKVFGFFLSPSPFLGEGLGVRVL
jgi:hypothetical protein